MGRSTHTGAGNGDLRSDTRRGWGFRLRHEAVAGLGAHARSGDAVLRSDTRREWSFALGHEAVGRALRSKRK